MNPFQFCYNLVSDIRGGGQTEEVSDEDAEENNWTKDR
jgi:hypothetical protein